MMKIFTKKSVAVILAIVVLAGFSNFHSVTAQTSSVAPVAPVFQYTSPDNSSVILRYDYVGNKLWRLEGSSADYPLLTTSILITDFNLPVAIRDAANKYDIDIAAYNQTQNTNTAKPTTLAEKIGGWAGKIVSFGLGSVGDWVSTGLSFIIQLFLIPLASIGLAIGGIILDFSVQFTIFGEGFRNPSIQNAVQSVWVLIRDIANIAFIFILLYAAIVQIIEQKPAQKILSSVVIAAILINFSLFVTRIVVDGSNLMATALYNQITLTGSSSNAVANIVKSFGSGIAGGAPGVDLSGSIMDGLGLTTMFDSQSSNSNANTSVVTGVGGLIFSALKVITFWIATFVFFAVAALLVGRFITLVILMATSPIWFLGGLGIPSIAKYTEKWRTSLLNQFLMAPIIMFFMLLTIRLSQILASNPAAATNPMIGFFNFFLVAYLLLKSVSVAKDMSGEFSKIIDTFASTATGAAIGLASGGTALLARQTVGRAATNIANSSFGERMSQMAASPNIISSAIGKAGLGITGGAAKGTFDVRNTGAMKEVLGRAKGIAGTDLISSESAKSSGVYGKGQTGFAGLIEKQTKEAVKQGEEYEKTSSAFRSRFVDEQIVEKLLKEEHDKADKVEQLEKEKDPTKKADLEKKFDAKESELKAQLVSVREQRISAQSKPEDVISKIQKSDTDFGAAEAKINNYKRQQEEIARKKDQAQKDKATDMTKEGIDKANADLEKLDQQSKSLDAEIEKTNKELDQAKRFMNMKDILNESDLKLIKDSKEIKRTFAKQIRERVIMKVVGLHTPGEDIAMARAVEKEKSDKDKEKEKKDKETKKMKDDIKKEMKEEGSEKK